MAQWLDEVIEAVRSQVPRTEKAGPSKPQNFGAAKRTGDDGWYEISTAGRPVKADELADLQLLAGPPGEGHPAFRVFATLDATDAIKVQVGAHAPTSGLSLWASRIPSGMLMKSLLKALENLERPGLADDLAKADLTPVPPSVPDPRALGTDQARALHACVTPGLRAIWGPPGTGKTTVLSHAVDILLTQGQRVLLVSGTNIAVDNVLSRVVSARQPAPGELVRVGTPQLAEIQQDARVALPKLVEARLRELTGRRDAVQRELMAMAGSSTLARLAQLEAELDGYDHASYLRAKSKADNEPLVSALESAVVLATRGVDGARADQAACRRQVDEARRNSALAAPAIAMLDHVDASRAELDTLAKNANDLRAKANALEGRYNQAVRAHNDVADRSAWHRVRNGRRIQTLARVMTASGNDLRIARAAADLAEAELRSQTSVVQRRIQEMLREAAPLDRPAVQRLEVAVSNATTRLDRATTALASADAQYRSAVEELRRAQRMGIPTDGDRKLITAAESASLPAKFEQRRLQRMLAEDVLQRRQELAERYEGLLTELAKQQAEAEPEIIASARLIATTLARIHMSRPVAEGQYDVVLIDEAAAAALPELLLAASKGRRTVVILGDFCQLGPIQPTKLPKEPTLSRWFTRDCFQLVGIDRPEDAMRHPGCVGLLTTHRFGPHVVELANRIAYGGYLRARDRAVDDTEIVLITTDELGEMAVIRKPGVGSGRWWPAGTIIAHALAERHRARGETVGIVTPYKAQCRATLDYLQDAGTLGSGIEVGTTHAFQGREFDAVVLDLVEDGTTPGWAAKGSLRSPDLWRRDGARLINVGATRARRRLYIITSWKALNTQPDTAVAQIRAMAVDKTIRGVRASTMLGIEESARTTEPDPLTTDIWHAFAGHVTVDSIHDEHTYFPAAVAAIREAKHSIWLWTPWFQERMLDVLPHLVAARDRGVRLVVFVSDARDNELHKDPEKQAQRQGWFADLENSVSVVVRIKMMHQKILIIDEKITFLGSLNTLSLSKKRPRREIMVQHRGTRYARRVLEHERAERFSAPPSCGRCKHQMELRRSNADSLKFAWFWVCPNHRDERQLIPDDKPTRGRH